MEIFIVLAILASAGVVVWRMDALRKALVAKADVNQDGSINLDDAKAAAAAAKSALDSTLEKAKSLADANQDGSINLADLKDVISKIKAKL